MKTCKKQQDTLLLCLNSIEVGANKGVTPGFPRRYIQALASTEN